MLKLPPYTEEKKSAPSESLSHESENAPPLPPKAQNFHQESASAPIDGAAVGDYDTNGFSMPPSYEQSNENRKGNPQASRQQRHNLLDDDLALPSVPDTHPSANNLDQSVDFDELAKRFENLKSKK